MADLSGGSGRRVGSLGMALGAVALLAAPVVGADTLVVTRHAITETADVLESGPSLGQIGNLPFVIYSAWPLSGGDTLPADARITKDPAVTET